MAVLIPEVPKSCPTSERLVYERLGRDLPADWIVLHSLGLKGHETKVWGEADIVILSTLGVFALEVKGGTVSCRDGVWTYTGDFPEFTRKESPWAQAMGAMGAIRGCLKDAGGGFGQVLYGFGVVMPFTEFTDTGVEILPEVLLDKRNFRQSLDHYVRALHAYWLAEGEQKHHRTYRGLRPDELREARRILRPDLETALSLGGYLTGVESRIVALTNEQIRASRRMAANPRTVVRGAAGTGKSVIAVERARQLAAGGLRVLFLCFNQLLATHVRRALADTGHARELRVWHAHAFYRDLIEGAGLRGRLQGEDPGSDTFFSETFPELAAEALCLRSAEPWDVLVVDEAQDLLTPAHLDVFDLLLRGGLRRGSWHLFLDPLQNIYGADVESVVKDRLEDYAPAFDDLFENCRNTRQVAVQTSIASGIDLPVAGAADGPACEVHYYGSPAEAVTAMETLIRSLTEGDVRAADIAILSTRRRDKSLLAGQTRLAGRNFADPSDEAALKGGALLFTTMHAFKGLERQAVIALDLEELGEPAWAMLHYAGLSRARCLLHLMMPASRQGAYERQAKAYGLRLAQGGAGAR